MLSWSFLIQQSCYIMFKCFHLSTCVVPLPCIGKTLNIVDVLPFCFFSQICLAFIGHNCGKTKLTLVLSWKRNSYTQMLRVITQLYLKGKGISCLVPFWNTGWRIWKQIKALGGQCFADAERRTVGSCEFQYKCKTVWEPQTRAVLFILRLTLQGKQMDTQEPQHTLKSPSQKML